MDLKELTFLTTKQINALHNKNIETVEDFLSIKPTKYYIPTTIDHMEAGLLVAVRCKITQIYYNSNNITCIAEDEFGRSMMMTWFGNLYLERMLSKNMVYVFYGKVVLNEYKNCWQIINPLFERKSEVAIKPVYKKIRGITEDTYNKIIDESLSELSISDVYSSRIRNKFQLPTINDAYHWLHHPATQEELKAAERYFLFDELFTLAVSLRKWSPGEVGNAIRCNKMSSVPELLSQLPFPLTDGPDSQLETIRNIIRKINKGVKTNSLVQGDVGCGKTMVAIVLMLIMAENGFQSVLMAPTNVLAQQHFKEITKTLERFDFVSTALLTGDMKQSEKRAVLKKIESGEANVIIGTHAVLSDAVVFNNLGLSIVDEEHRFGVKQREAITERYKNINTVIMSATPIPRTVGVVLYGSETDFYTIKQMPAGRKPVATKIVTEVEKGYQAIYEEIQKGHQAYVICPLVEESSSEKMAEVTSINEAYERLKQFFSFDDSIQIGVISGQLKADDLKTEINKFVNNEYQVLVSTTVVEVGVNVPNATIILIENSERFGLAQLHQLRGRVGRNSLQSYCLLSTPKTDVERLEVMTSTTDGFLIAQEDVRLRGVGDLAGTKQCGVYDNVIKMLANRDLYQMISEEVDNMIRYIREYEKIQAAIQQQS